MGKAKIRLVLMKKKLYLSLLLLFFVAEVSGQQKKAIKACAINYDRAAFMSTHVPKWKPVKNNKNLPVIKDNIRKQFQIDAVMLSANAYRIDQYTIVEAFYRSKGCDTVALLFAFTKGKKYMVTRPYKIVSQNYDIRYQWSPGELSLYRKIRGRYHKYVTMHVEIDTKDCKLREFLDDGHSWW